MGGSRIFKWGKRRKEELQKFIIRQKVNNCFRKYVLWHFPGVEGRSASNMHIFKSPSPFLIWTTSVLRDRGLSYLNMTHAKLQLCPGHLTKDGFGSIFKEVSIKKLTLVEAWSPSEGLYHPLLFSLYRGSVKENYLLKFCLFMLLLISLLCHLTK